MREWGVAGGREKGDLLVCLVGTWVVRVWQLNGFGRLVATQTGDFDSYITIAGLVVTWVVHI